MLVIGADGTITNESGISHVTLSTIKTYDLVGTPGFSQAKLNLKENQTLESLNETDEWVSELKKGLKEYPDHDYFFATLMAYFSDVKKYNEALFYTDKMIQHNPLNWHYWFVKAQIHLCKEEYNETIAACNKVIQLQPKNVDAHYYLGLSYCNLAKLSTELMKSVPLNSDLYKKYKSM